MIKLFSFDIYMHPPFTYCDILFHVTTLRMCTSNATSTVTRKRCPSTCHSSYVAINMAYIAEIRNCYTAIWFYYIAWKWYLRYNILGD